LNLKKHTLEFVPQIYQYKLAKGKKKEYLCNWPFLAHSSYSALLIAYPEAGVRQWFLIGERFCF
jgi:hypothetical protein